MNQLKKIALLSVSLLVVSSGAIAANIPEIQKTYPSIYSTLVELITTLPSLFIILTILVSQKIAKKIGYRLTVQIGILLVFFSGILPAFTTSFWVLFMSRMLFGIGVGLFNPLLFSFTANLYQGKELSSVIGLQSSFEGIGGMFVTFLVGQLLLIHWKTSFLAYFLAFPIFILFSLFVPEIKPDSKWKTKNKSTNSTVHKEMYGYLLLLVIVVTVYMSLTVKITSLLLEKNYGNATNGSNMLALVGFGAMMAGIFFGKLVTVSKQWTLPFAFLGMSLAMFGISFSKSLLLTSLMVTFCGFSFRTFIPYLFNEINQNHQENAEKNTSLLLIAFNLGAAFAPISISLFVSIFSIKDNASIFIVEGILMLFLAGVVAAINYIKKNSYEKNQEV